MNSKNIKKHLHYKVEKWIESINDENVRNVASKGVLITGGAITSLLLNEEVNDYDVYFKDMETAKIVANYYANIFNLSHNKAMVEIVEKDDKIKCFIKSSGVAQDNTIDDPSEPNTNIEVSENSEFKPRYFTSNAITLSDKFQLIIRFYGSIEQIHENFDFAHCTCSYDFYSNELSLPNHALECILNKELFYSGSKYPLCSIIRTRKYISRGYTINAGQYVKMALQLQELDLLNKDVLEDQLTGVDSAYFDEIIKHVKEKDDNIAIDSNYLIELINKLF